MCLIAVQRYIKIQRVVTSTAQKNVEHKRYIYLYNDKIVTEHREFSIGEVIDMSYRKTSEIGLLYIHTSRGLYSYIVKTSAQKFIEIFRKHKEKHS